MTLRLLHCRLLISQPMSVNQTQRPRLSRACTLAARTQTWFPDRESNPGRGGESAES